MSTSGMSCTASTSTSVPAYHVSATASNRVHSQASCRLYGSFSASPAQRLARRCSHPVQSRRSPARRPCLVTRSMMEPEGELVPEVDEGTRIKVTKEVTVYHAPKIPELNLQGKEGTVKSIVKKFKGKELSANLPYRVEFVLDPENEKAKKLLVHLDASEFEIAE